PQPAPSPSPITLPKRTQPQRISTSRLRQRAAKPTARPPPRSQTDPQSRTKTARNDQGDPRQSLRLHDQPRPRSHQQWLGTGATPLRRLSKDHKRLSQRMGRQVLRRPSFGRRNRTKTSDPRHRRHPPHPEKPTAAQRCLSVPTGTSCLDGAPSSRVWLRLCERFGCGHVFGLLARETNVPLALMLVRMALRPISKTRSLWRLPFSSGFRADPLVPMSGRRPVVKGLVEALRTLRVRSCLRPVGAGNECPAGPDVGPHGSSPNQQNALV